MDLTLIGFVIAVVGIILQVADAFPEHRETRKVIVLLALGLFIGIVASALLGAKYEITGDVDRRYVLLYALVGLGALFALVACFVENDKRREVAIFSAVGCAAVFMLAGFAVAMGSVDRSGPYSTDEIMLLANAAEKSGQYELAIDRLEELQGRFKSQAAYDELQKRIERLHAKQIAANGAQPALVAR